MIGRRKAVISVRPAPLGVAVPIFQVLSLYRVILIVPVGVRLGALLIPVFAPSDIAHAISLIQATYARAVTCMSFWRARRRMLKNACALEHPSFSNSSQPSLLPLLHLVKITFKIMTPTSPTLSAPTCLVVWLPDAELQNSNSRTEDNVNNSTSTAVAIALSELLACPPAAWSPDVLLEPLLV
ncbi:hypothetical protein B0H13DRAFT_2313613 [Mycena leptocephala]|nr:hypothetical protein B0H13DRAFT_2313613 [Mycena leptocephala]